MNSRRNCWKSESLKLSREFTCTTLATLPLTMANLYMPKSMTLYRGMYEDKAAQLFSELQETLQFLRAAIQRIGFTVDTCEIERRRNYSHIRREYVDPIHTNTHIYTLKVYIAKQKEGIRCRRGYLLDFYIRDGGITQCWRHVVYPMILPQDDWSRRLTIDEQIDVSEMIHWWWATYIPPLSRRTEKKQRQVSLFKEELVANVWHPRRVEKILEAGGFELLDSL